MAILTCNWGKGSVWCVTSGVFVSNSYICETGVPGQCILIDAGLDALTIDEEMCALGLHPTTVFCTHGHFDHIGSAAYFQKKYGCRVYIHHGDIKTMKSSNFMLMALKIPQRVEMPEINEVDDNSIFEISGEPLKFLPAPGHTPGSCVIEFGNCWFTGDTIYSRGVGLSSLPGENALILKKSISGLWGRLTEDRLVHPGHGKVENGAWIRRENYALLKFLGVVVGA